MSASGPGFPIAVARPGPLLGQLPHPSLQRPQERGEQEAGVRLWASRCPWVPVWKLESLVMGGEERISKALGGGRVQWAPSSPRVQPWGHLWGREKPSVSGKQTEALGTCLRGSGACSGSLVLQTLVPLPSRSGPPFPPSTPRPPGLPPPHAAIFMTLGTTGPQRPLPLAPNGQQGDRGGAVPKHCQDALVTGGSTQSWGHPSPRSHSPQPGDRSWP